MQEVQDARQAGDGRNRRAQRGISRGARPHGTRRQPLGVVLPLGAASAAASGCGGLAPTAALLNLVNLLDLLPGVPATASAARQFHFALKNASVFAQGDGLGWD